MSNVLKRGIKRSFVVPPLLLTVGLIVIVYTFLKLVLFLLFKSVKLFRTLKTEKNLVNDLFFLTLSMSGACKFLV